LYEFNLVFIKFLLKLFRSGKELVIFKDFKKDCENFLPGLQLNDQNVQLKITPQFHFSLLNRLKNEEKTVLIGYLNAIIEKLGKINRNKKLCIFIIASILYLDQVYLQVVQFFLQTLCVTVRNALKRDENDIVDHVIGIASQNVFADDVILLIYYSEDLLIHPIYQLYEEKNEKINALLKQLAEKETNNLVSFDIERSSIQILFEFSDIYSNVTYNLVKPLNLSQFDLYKSFSLKFSYLCVRNENYKVKMSRLCNYKSNLIKKTVFQFLKDPATTLDLKIVRLIGDNLSNYPHINNLNLKCLIDNLNQNRFAYRKNIKSIETIGLLASESDPEAFHKFSSIIPFLIESIQDLNNRNQKQISLWAFGKIIANTGYVIEPYRKHPNLFNILVDFLQNETNVISRREAIHIFGLIGAMDPYKYKQNLLLNPPKHDSNAIKCDPILNKTKIVFEKSEIISILNSAESLNEYFSLLTFNILIKIMKNSIDICLRRNALQALYLAMECLNNKCVNYIEFIIPEFLELMKNMNDNFVIDLVTTLRCLLVYVRKYIGKYINNILEIVAEFFNVSNEQNMISSLIDLNQSIVNIMDVQYKKYLPQTIPFILKKLKHEIYEKNSQNMSKMFTLIITCSSFIDSYTTSILTQFIENLNDANVDIEVKKQIVFTIYKIAEKSNLFFTLYENIDIVFRTFAKLFDEYLVKLPLSDKSLTTAKYLKDLKHVDFSSLEDIEKINLNFTENLYNMDLNAFEVLKNVKYNPLEVLRKVEIVVLIFDASCIIAKHKKSMFDKILSANDDYSKLFEKLKLSCNDVANIKTSRELTQANKRENIHVTEKLLNINNCMSGKSSTNESKSVKNKVKPFFQVKKLQVYYIEAKNLTSSIEWSEK
jgi:hypothetical protein